MTFTEKVEKATEILYNHHECFGYNKAITYLSNHTCLTFSEARDVLILHKKYTAVEIIALELQRL